MPGSVREHETQARRKVLGSVDDRQPGATGLSKAMQEDHRRFGWDLCHSGYVQTTEPRRTFLPVMPIGPWARRRDRGGTAVMFCHL